MKKNSPISKNHLINFPYHFLISDAKFKNFLMKNSWNFRFSSELIFRFFKPTQNLQSSTLITSLSLRRPLRGSPILLWNLRPHRLLLPPFPVLCRHFARSKSGERCEKSAFLPYSRRRIIRSDRISAPSNLKSSDFWRKVRSARRQNGVGCDESEAREGFSNGANGQGFLWTRWHLDQGV